MSSNQNKTIPLSAIIILIGTMFCTISISAQSTAAVNGSTAGQNTIPETKETPAEKKLRPAADGTDLTPRPATTLKVNPPSEVSDSSKTGPDTKLASGDSNRDAASNTASPVPQTPSSDGWQFQFTPYLWLPSLHGTAGVGNRSSGVNESFRDLLSALDFVFMGTFEAHKGKFSSLSDLEFVHVSDKKATPGPLFSDAEANLKNFVFDTEAGYRVLSKPDKGSFVDVVGGVRFWHVNADLAFGAGILPAVEVQGSRNWADAVAGLRGKAAVSKKFFVVGKFDLGGGGAKFTYQVFGSGGYKVNERFSLLFGYRLLNVNYNKNNFIYDITQRGPIVGFGFKF